MGSQPFESVPPPGRTSTRRRWPRRLAIALAGLGLLAVGLRVALPFAIEWAVAWAAPRYLGLPVHIENVDLGLARGRVALEGFVLGSRPAPAEGGSEAIPPEAALLRLERVFADLDWRPLRDRTLHLRLLEIDAPVLQLERLADGRVDPLAHAAPTAPPAPPETEAAPDEAAPPAPPWTVVLDRLHLSRPDAKIVEPAAGAPLLAFSLEDFALEDVRVRGEEIGLGGVGVRGPVLRVQRRFLFGGASAPAAAAGAPAPPAPAGAPPEAAPPGAAPDYRVERIAVERARFTWLTDEQPLDVTLGFEARGVSARAGERFPVKLDLEIEGGTLALDGEAGILPPSYAGRLVWKELRVPLLSIAALPELGGWLRSCRASGELDVTAALAAGAGGAAPGVVLRGRAAVDDLALADPQGDVSVEWSSLELVIGEIALPVPVAGAPPGTTRVALERVTLVAPSVRYRRPAPALAALLAPPAAATPGPETGDAAAPAPGSGAEDAAAPLELTVGVFELRGGSADFEDRTLPAPYRGRLRALAVSARDVRFPALAARGLVVRGRSADGGAFTLRGDLRGETGSATLELERLALAPFNPYAASAAGYRLGGEASLDSEVAIRGPRYATENRLVLHRLDVASETPGDFEARFGVPLDLALALLRGPGGDIALTIPVGVDEGGVSTGIGTIVAGALRQALVGALSSPLKLVGAAFSGGGDGPALGGIEPLAGVPGAAPLAPGEETRLAGRAELLTERPALALRLRGRAGPEDVPLVAEQILTEGVGAGEDLPALADGGGFLARRRVAGALAKRARGEAAELDPQDQALLARYVAAVPVPAERLAALAQQRAETLRDAVTAAHGLDASRFEIAEAAPEGAPGVVVELTAR